MLEVLGKGFGETLLTRRVFPILLLGLRTGKRNLQDSSTRYVGGLRRFPCG
jgi:hypothetical protein